MYELISHLDKLMYDIASSRFAQDDEGNPTSWLVDDAVVQCWSSTRVVTAIESTWNTEATTTRSHLWLVVYSACMIVVIVIGFPAVLLQQMWSWRNPFDRMYFVDEDGIEKPTAEALEALDTIVMFRSECWAMAILDMVSFITNW